jgi:hypothetical protein
MLSGGTLREALRRIDKGTLGRSDEGIDAPSSKTEEESSSMQESVETASSSLAEDASLQRVRASNLWHIKDTVEVEDVFSSSLDKTEGAPSKDGSFSSMVSPSSLAEDASLQRVRVSLLQLKIFQKLCQVLK